MGFVAFQSYYFGVWPKPSLTVDDPSISEWLQDSDVIIHRRGFKRPIDNSTMYIQKGQRIDGCPASTIFAGWRQSVLPVHLLGLAPLLGSVGPVAGDVKLQDDGVVHDPVNRRGAGHGVGKDALPLREDQV